MTWMRSATCSLVAESSAPDEAHVDVQKGKGRCGEEEEEGDEVRRFAEGVFVSLRSTLFEIIGEPYGHGDRSASFNLFTSGIDDEQINEPGSGTVGKWVQTDSQADAWSYIGACIWVNYAAKNRPAKWFGKATRQGIEGASN